MWTDELMGNGNGYVKTGPFKNWDANVLMPLSSVPIKKLFRFFLQVKKKQKKILDQLEVGHKIDYCR